MSDCDFCIDMGYDGEPEFYRARDRRARKPFKCGECGRTFPPGTIHEYVSARYDGAFFAFRTCADCQAIREAFVCGSFVHGELWAELEASAFPKFSEACLSKIEGAGAKQFIADQWRSWKGLAA